MVNKNIVATAACLLLFCIPLLPTSAQPARIDLIVRPSDDADFSLNTSLAKAKAARPTGDSLFQGVEGVQAIGGGRSGRGKSAGASGSSFRAYRLQVRDSTALRQLKRRWTAHPDVAYAHPNYTFRVEAAPQRDSLARALLDGNSFADSLNHLDAVRAIEAWSATGGDEAVSVGVIDTGFYLDHPDLANQFWVNEAEDLNGNGRLDEEDLNGIDDDGNGYVDDVVGYDFVDRSNSVQEGEFANRDPDPSADPKGRGSGHGSSVAGIIAASPGGETGIAGVAPNTRIVALRAFGGDGIGASDDIAAAIAYGADMGIDVLNLSFGRSRSVPLIRDAIEYANEQGTVVVASAGNELTDDPHYPSDHPEVLSVAWLAEDGQGLPDFNRSQFGIGVDLGAPGTNVYTADFPAAAVREGRSPEQGELYHFTNGSSFSAPQVAGAAALLRSVDSSLTPASIRSILTGTATDILESGWDHRSGAGLLNAEQALLQAYPARTAIEVPDHNQGLSGTGSVPIVGTALDPGFQSYSVYVAEGTKNLDDRPDPWRKLAGPTTTQALRDTLARWSTAALEEGEYTLRLSVTRRDGGTVEDRRRVIIDRSPPTLDVEFLGWGRVQGTTGIVGDIVADDRVRLRTTVALGGTRETIQSERITRRHGIGWSNEEGKSGPADVQITATNRSGLTTTLDTTLQVPANRENTALLRRTETAIPRGVLLPDAPDFDGDGLPEVVLNQSREGGISDTLRSFEWVGSGFAPADTLLASFAPRDVGDTDGDGLQELLLQIRQGTLVLEQDTPTSFPTSLVYADTIGANTSIGEVLGGIRFTNVDGDGQGEILGTLGKTLEVLERTADGSFETVFQLENPTTEVGRDSVLANAYDTPNAAAGDFDGDGRRDLLAGDRDGDLVVYESTGDDAMAVAWTHESDRVDAGNRFATGDFAGTGSTSFATMATYFPRELPDGEFEAPITYYSVWQSTGDDAYERVYRLPIAGPYVGQGAMTAADLEGDGRDEIVIAHSPSLLVLDRSASGNWRVRHQNEAGAPLQSRRLVATDFSGDGRPSILAETAAERLARFVVNEQAVAVSPPEWRRARPTGQASGELVWRAPGADSVAVLSGPVDGALGRDTVVTDSSYTPSDARERRYVLRAWKSGTPSPLSASRTLRPHAPATVASISYPSAQAVQLRFEEPLSSGLRAEQFRLGSEGRSPRELVQTNGGTGVVLRFGEAVAGQSMTLRWTEVVDQSGLPVGQTSASVSFPASSKRSLFVEAATVLSTRRVRLTFSDALDPAAATDPSRYEVQPRGRVASVEQSDGDPSVVTVRVEGIVIGPSGQETALQVTEMQSETGRRLAEEGSTVRLTKPASDLSNVYVYPNPHRARDHDGTMTVAGLPSTATVRIYSPDGRLVRVLDVEDNRRGGADWNLRDQRGERVPSGVYLFRVTAPGESAVLKKGAVIR